MRDHELSVVVVDDHALFAEALIMALGQVGLAARHLSPRPQAGPRRPVREQILSAQPDLVLLDLDLGASGSAMPMIPTLAERGIPVIVVTGSEDQARWGEALHRGARAVVSKSSSFGHIVNVVRRFGSGVPVMAREERARLVEVYQVRQKADAELRARFAQLTNREEQVLAQLMAGRQVSEIARRRYVSEATVRTQVKAVLAKLQVPSQLTAVSLAHRTRWQPTTPPLGRDGR